MKITHVINSLATGGAERLVVELATYAIKQGHEVEIVLLQDIPGIPRLEAKERDLSITVLGNSLKDPRLIFRLNQATKNADIVHVHLFPALYWASFISKPKVFTEHSTRNRRIGKRLFKVPEQIVYAKYNRILAISNGVMNSAQHHISNIGATTKVSLAVNGIAEEFFTGERIYSKAPKRITSVGSLKEVKQHHLAIMAVSKLDGIYLKIAGEGILRGPLEELIQELDLSNRVELLGNVQDIPTLLQQTDLLLSTSAYEGFSLAAGEAQATGIPVVGPNIEGFREIVLHNETGLLYDSPTPDAIAETIKTALESANYLRLAQNTISHASKYSIANSFINQLAIYTEIVKK